MEGGTRHPERGSVKGILRAAARHQIMSRYRVIQVAITNGQVALPPSIAFIVLAFTFISIPLRKCTAISDANFASILLSHGVWSVRADAVVIITPKDYH
jgi:hypothetical protein